MTDFKINVIADPSQAISGINKVDKHLATTSTRADRLRVSMAGAFSGLVVGALIRELLQLADSFTTLQNRVRNVTSSTQELTTVTNELFKIAQKTRSSFETTANGYARTALSVKTLGLSQRQTLNFTESLNKAIIVSGATSAEASAGLIQLSQGLASGRLQGDELRSVLEQLPYVADVLATGLGAIRGDLRDLGAQGKITSQVIIDAFEKARVEIAEKFAKTIPTLAQSLTIFKNSLVKIIGDFDTAAGVTQRLAKSIILLSQNLDSILKVVIALGVGFAINLAAKGILVAFSAFKAFGVLLLANPLGALLTTLVLVTGFLITFSSDITIASNSLTTLSDVGIAAFTLLKTAIAPLIKAFSDFFKPLSDSATKAFGEINFSVKGVLKVTAIILDSFINLWRIAFNSIVAIFSTLPALLADVFFSSLNGVITLIETFINEVSKGINIASSIIGAAEIPSVKLDRIVNEYEGAGSKMGEALIAGFTKASGKKTLQNLLTDVLKEAENVKTSRVAANQDKIRREQANQAALNKPGVNTEDPIGSDFKRELKRLQQETELLKLSNNERTVRAGIVKIERKLTRDLSDVKNKLGESEKSLALATVIELDALQKKDKVYQSIIEPQREIMSQLESLMSLYNDSKISVDQLNASLVQLGLAQAQLNIEQGNGGFTDGFIVGIQSMLTEVQNFTATAGEHFAGFFTSLSEGFSKAIGDSIIFGTNFKEAFGNVARQALSSLIASFVQLGIQYIITAAIGKATSSALIATNLAEAAAVGTAWATPASLVSLASFGANGVPASAAIASTTALANSLAITSFAEGGIIKGAGTGTSDSIPAMVSNGEFVVNAKATANNRALLETLNSGSPRFKDGGLVKSPSPNETNNSANTQGVGVGQSAPSQNVRIINVIDPAMVEDYLTSGSGERVIVNLIERNSGSINSILSGVA